MNLSIPGEKSVVKNLSFSSLSKFAECPRSWWVHYIDENRSAPTEAASFGSQFDQVISNRLGIGEKPEEEVLDGVEDLANFYLCQPGAWTSAEEAQKKIELSPNQFEFLAEQLGLTVQGLRFPFIGYLDLLRRSKGVVEILDLKTSSRSEFRPSWAMQVFGIYSLATGAQRAEVHLLVRLKNGPKMMVYTFRPTKDTWVWAVRWIDYWSARVNHALDENAGEELPRNPGYYCGWCAEQFDCPAALFNGFRGG